MADTNPSPLFARLKTARRLPTPAGTALRVLELCRDDESGTREIADTIASDPALSARLLKFANSAAVGLKREVLSIREAVLLMGVRSVKLAALGFSLASPDSKSACKGFDLQGYWREACAAAVIARMVSREPFGAEPEEAFTAALLAKIGRLAMAQGIPEEYSRVLEDAAGGVPLPRAEALALGSDHVEFGAELLADWNLPEVLVEAVRRQQTPERCAGKAGPLSRAIAAAYALAPLFCEAKVALEVKKHAREVVAGQLKLEEPGWAKLSERVREAYQQTASALNVKLTQESVMDLYAEAQEEATRVGMVAQLEKAQATQDAQELLKRANTDALTGIANRARFDERMDELVKGIPRGHGHFALVMFDIDHFKKFNDTHGHQTGDLVLVRVARAVQNSLRDVDFLARYGGEEFAILTPATSREGACLVAARTRQVVEAMKVQCEAGVLAVTISVGVVVSSDYAKPPGGATLIEEADKQMYLSKRAGRNTWSYQGRSAARAPAPAPQQKAA
jgi:diguanylate cyclase (GGDEF)-like protein